MNILFIHPGGHKKIYQDLSGEFTAIAPPTWAVLLGTYLQKLNYNVSIYDSNICGWDKGKIQNIISQYNPNYIIILAYGHHPSASTQIMPSVIEISHDLKEFNSSIKLVVGGLHPSVLPELTLKETGADFVFTGVGNGAIEEILNSISEKGIYNTPRLPKFMDELYPDCSWDLLGDLSLYRAHNHHCFQYFEEDGDSMKSRKPYVTIYTSVGCPFNCSYCCIHGLFENRPGINYWNAETVIRWIDDLVVKHKVKNIRIDDELFILDFKRVEKICDYIIERKYDLNIWAYGRVDVIDIPLLKKLKKAGFNWLCLGIESGDDDIRRIVNKKLNVDIKNIVKIIQDNRIFVQGNFMFGLPEDTFESMQTTYDLAVELNCESVNFYSMMKYPGSIYYKQEEKNNWSEYSQHSYDCTPLSGKYLSSKDILKFRDEKYDEYHKSERYLSMIKTKFGDKTVEHINEMVKIKLNRKLME